MFTHDVLVHVERVTNNGFFKVSFIDYFLTCSLHSRIFHYVDNTMFLIIIIFCIFFNAITIF